MSQLFQLYIMKTNTEFRGTIIAFFTAAESQNNHLCGCQDELCRLCCVPICNNVPICNKLLQIGTHMLYHCVPICNKLLQIGTHLHCSSVPICNKLLQISTHLQCICVPICNKILYFRWYTEHIGEQRGTFFTSKQQISGECGLWHSHNSYH